VWPDDLERKLRDRVAKHIQRQILEHNVGEATISRRIIRALDRFNNRIGRLIFAAEMDAMRHLRQIERFAIRPRPADARDLAFTQANSKRERVRIIRARNAWPAFAAANLCRLRALLELSRPDHLARQPHAPVHQRQRRALG